MPGLKRSFKMMYDFMVIILFLITEGAISQNEIKNEWCTSGILELIAEGIWALNWCGFWRQEYFHKISKDVTKIYSVLLIVRSKFILEEMYHDFIISLK